MKVVITSIKEFDRQIKQLAKKYPSFALDFQSWTANLMSNPSQGVSLGGGLRKIRMAITSKGKGKSGGARVITFNVQQQDDVMVITLLTIYDKNEMENISDSFIQSLIANL